MTNELSYLLLSSLSQCLFLLCGRVLVGYCGGGWPAHKHFRLPLSLYVLDTLFVCSQFSPRCSYLYEIRFNSDSRLIETRQKCAAALSFCFRTTLSGNKRDLGKQNEDCDLKTL